MSRRGRQQADTTPTQAERKEGTNSRRSAAIDRAARIERTSGILTGVYRSDYLKRLRADWPD
jgi:hypothetical protein